MLKLFRVFLAVIVLLLTGWALITGIFVLQLYAALFTGLLVLVMGIEDHRSTKLNSYGWASIVLSIFVLYVSIQGLILN